MNIVDLLLAVAQLTLLTMIGWLISRRLGRHIRFQQKLAQQQVELTRAAATYRARSDDPHTTIRRIATNATRRPIGELTPRHPVSGDPGEAGLKIAVDGGDRLLEGLSPQRLGPHADVRPG